MDATLQQRLAVLEQALGLPRPPIGLAYVAAAPTGMARPDTSVPSACSFWRMAERQVFYAAEEDHFNCPIGMMTMGFRIPPQRQAEAEAIVKTMCDLEYISPEEAATLPSVSKDHRGIVYGPLSQMPVNPDVALFFCKPGQAMLLAEASGGVTWTGQGISAFGRPTCAAIPTALKLGNISMSVGCVGFRVYTGLPDEEMVIAVPRGQLQGLADRLGTTLAANSALEQFHTQRRSLTH